MFFHILKRDLKRKKTMNMIMLLFHDSGNDVHIEQYQKYRCYFDCTGSLF